MTPNGSTASAAFDDWHRRAVIDRMAEAVRAQSRHSASSAELGGLGGSEDPFAAAQTQAVGACKSSDGRFRQVVVTMVRISAYGFGVRERSRLVFHRRVDRFGARKARLSIPGSRTR